MMPSMKIKERKTARFELLLKPSEKAALGRLSAKRGESRAKVITGLVERLAKREKVWSA